MTIATLAAAAALDVIAGLLNFRPLAMPDGRRFKSAPPKAASSDGRLALSLAIKLRSPTAFPTTTTADRLLRQLTLYQSVQRREPPLSWLPSARLGRFRRHCFAGEDRPTSCC